MDIIVRKENRRRNKVARQSGFNLVEALVGLAVTAIGVAALYGGMMRAWYSTGLAEENLRATQILHQNGESLKVRTWDQLHSNEIVPKTFVAYGSSDGSSNGIVYEGTVSLSPMPASDCDYTNDMRQVTIALVWTSRGLRHERELTSYVSRYGMQYYLLYD